MTFLQSKNRKEILFLVSIVVSIFVFSIAVFFLTFGAQSVFAQDGTEDGFAAQCAYCGNGGDDIPQGSTGSTCPGAVISCVEQGGDNGGTVCTVVCPIAVIPPPTLNPRASCNADGSATFTWDADTVTVFRHADPGHLAGTVGVYAIQLDNETAGPWEFAWDFWIGGWRNGDFNHHNQTGTSFNSSSGSGPYANAQRWHFWLNAGGWDRYNVMTKEHVYVTCSPTTTTSPAPPSASISCNTAGNQATFSWAVAPGATEYYPRFATSAGSCPSGWTLFTDGTTCYINGYTPTSVSFPVEPGRTYNNTWVHSGTNGIVNWNVSASAGAFTCVAPITVTFQGNGCILPAGGGSCNITSYWTVNGLPVGETVDLHATGPGIAHNYQKLPTTLTEAKTAVRSAFDAVYSALFSHARSAFAAVYGAGLSTTRASNNPFPVPVSQPGTFNLELRRNSNSNLLGTAIVLVACPFGNTINKAVDGSETCVPPIPTSNPTPLTLVSCTVSPSNTVSVGDTVRWTANVSGGTSPRFYSWTGTEGLSGTTAFVEKVYNATGTKSASVTVTDSSSPPASTGSVSCSATAGNVTVTVGIPTLLVTPNRVRYGEPTTVSGDLKGNTGCILSSTDVATHPPISLNTTAARDTYEGGGHTMTTIKGETTFTLTCPPQSPVTGKVRVLAQPVEI